VNSEFVICSAIATQSGRIIRGHRHHDCIRTALGMGDKPMSNTPIAQGFITSCNRYVDREEALQLQKAAGIKPVHGGQYHTRYLFSEDLY
jgi:hypothetical protein